MKKSIKQCTITLTRNCNLRCSFCYAKESGYCKNENIEFGEAKKIVDMCNDLKVKYIVLTGGEPTLYPHIVELIQYIKSKKHPMIATITTNGINLSTKSYCDKLSEIGVDYIDISLKGKDIQTYKTATGADGFSRQMEGIKNLAQTGIDFTCSMVITQENVCDFCDAVKAAYDYGARKFSFTFVIDNGNSQSNGKEYLMANNPFSLIEQFVSCIDRLNSISNGEWWIEYSYPRCFYTEEQLVQLKGRFADPCQIYYQNGITFDAKMNLIPCSMNINTVLGSLKENTCQKVFERIRKQASYKETIKKLNTLPSQKCKKCKHLKHCLGGCPFFWNHFSFSEFEEMKNDYYSKQYITNS